MRVTLLLWATATSHAFVLPGGATHAFSPSDARTTGGVTHVFSRVRAAQPSMLSVADASGIIDMAVSFDTFVPQPFWLLLVALPRTELTRKIMGPIGPVLGLSLVHLAIVVLAASKPGGTEPILIFADVFDPAQSQLAGMERLFEVRDFVAEEWPHVLIWDLFVGRAIWLDAISRDVAFAWPALLLTNGIGPPGLLLYVLISLVQGKGIPPLGGAVAARPIADESTAAKAAPAAPTPMPMPTPTPTPPSVLATRRAAEVKTDLPFGLSNPFARGGEGGGGGVLRGGVLRGGVLRGGASCESLILRLFESGVVDPEAVAAACTESVVWEDMSASLPYEGQAAVRRMLAAKWPPTARLVSG